MIVPQDLADQTENRWTTLLVVTGFVAVAVAQVSNMIVARGNAGAIPPFSLACIRWAIIGLGLAPFVLGELQGHRRDILASGRLVVLAGFCGMFLCGGRVYIAGISTTAINMALIMALSPLVVLVVAWLAGLEKIGQFQLLGLALALAGALAIVLRGGLGNLMSPATLTGDLLMMMAMLAWSGLHAVAVKGSAASLVPRSRLHVCRGRRALFAAFCAQRDVGRT
jgi:drug/metabolite transporter (DMT)-like permease